MNQVELDPNTSTSNKYPWTMDPLEVPMPINQTVQGAQDVVVDLDGNIFKTQVELGLIS